MKRPLFTLFTSLLLSMPSLSANTPEPPATTALVVVEAGASGLHKAGISEAGLKTEFVYEAIVEIGAPVVLGQTASGHKQYIPITGGSFKGSNLKGTVLPGGADWQTSRPDGVTEVDALYSMRCDDGTVIIVHNSGVITSDGGFYARTALRFQVQEGPHAWLTRAQFVGSVSSGPRPGTVSIKVFRLL